jgi:hypothetical protein
VGGAGGWACPLVPAGEPAAALPFPHPRLPLPSHLPRVSTHSPPSYLIFTSNPTLSDSLKNYLYFLKVRITGCLGKLRCFPEKISKLIRGNRGIRGLGEEDSRKKPEVKNFLKLFFYVLKLFSQTALKMEF